MIVAVHVVFNYSLVAKKNNKQFQYNENLSLSVISQSLLKEFGSSFLELKTETQSYHLLTSSSLNLHLQFVEAAFWNTAPVFSSQKSLLQTFHQVYQLKWICYMFLWLFSHTCKHVCSWIPFWSFSFGVTNQINSSLHNLISWHRVNCWLFLRPKD